MNNKVKMSFRKLVYRRGSVISCQTGESIRANLSRIKKKNQLVTERVGTPDIWSQLAFHQHHDV